MAIKGSRSIFNWKPIRDIKEKITDKQVRELKTLSEYFNSLPQKKVGNTVKHVRDMLDAGVDTFYLSRIRRLNNRHDKSAINLYMWVVKYGKHLGVKKFDEYNKSRASTLKNFIKRHGDEKGRKLFNEYRELQSYVGVTLEYFIEKYGEQAGKEEYERIIRLKSHTLDSYIERYGCEIVAREKLTQKYSNMSKRRYNSKEGDYFNSKLYQKIIESDIKGNVYFANKNKEFVIFNPYTRRVCMYDFTITSPTNIIIEYNGDYWHANPKFYKIGDSIKGTLVEDIWREDYLKQKAAEDRGFKYINIWASAFREDESGILNEIIRYIRDN